MIKFLKKNGTVWASFMLLATFALWDEASKPGTQLLASVAGGATAYLTIYLTVKSFIWEIEGIADEAVERIRKDAAK